MQKRKINILGRFLLILTIFALFVTGCERLNLKTASDSDGKTDSGDNIEENEDFEASDDTFDKQENESKDSNVGLESGFGASDETDFDFVAYKSDKQEFDIDDVTLQFFYGGYFSDYLGEFYDRYNSYPWFEIFFTNEDGGKILVKRVEEEFVSEKYRCQIIWDENKQVTGVEFNHSEFITIPKEIFTREKGTIWISFYGENVARDPVKYERITSEHIHYKVEGDRVLLSWKSFDELNA